MATVQRGNGVVDGIAISVTNASYDDAEIVDADLAVFRQPAVGTIVERQLRAIE